MAMTRGQESLMMDLLDDAEDSAEFNANGVTNPLIVLEASAEEQAAHEEYLAGLSKSGQCVWDSLTKA